MIDKFKDVVGYEEFFSVSEDGRVYSKRTCKVLKQTLHINGYWTIATKIGGRLGVPKCFKVHRLVAEAFIENPKNKPFVNHIDGNKQNNSVGNLEWVTNAENIQHAISIGLITPRRGEDAPLAQISDKIAYELYTLYIEMQCSVRILSELTGVPQGIVKRVVTNSSTSWKHIRN